MHVAASTLLALHALGLLLFLNYPSLILAISTSTSPSSSKDTQGKINEHKINEHIILIVIDDFGHADLQSSPLPPGATPTPTPFLSTLFSTSTPLKNFITYPQCTPSRTSLLTGTPAESQGMSHYVLVHGQDYCLPPTAIILPKLLPDNFKSHLVGKWHQGHARPSCLPTALGYDTFQGYLLGSIDFFTGNNTEVCGDGEVCGPTRRVAAFDSGYSDVHGLIRKDGEYITDTLTRAAIATVDEFAKGRRTAARAEPRQEADRLFLQVNMAATHSGPYGPSQFKVGDLDSAVARRSINRAGFGAMARNLDDNLEALFTRLEHHGILQNATVVVMSDNGGETSAGASNWPLRGEKFTYFQGGINAPAMISGVDVNGGSELFWVGDVAPTILESVGVKVPREMTGVSHVGGGGRREEPFVSGVDPVTGSGAVFYRGYKLVVNATGGYDEVFGKESLKGWSAPGDADDNATIVGVVNEVMLFNVMGGDGEERVDLAQAEKGIVDVCKAAFDRAIEETRGLERQTKARGGAMRQVTPKNGMYGPWIVDQ